MSRNTTWPPSGLMLSWGWSRCRSCCSSDGGYRSPKPERGHVLKGRGSVGRACEETARGDDVDLSEMWHSIRFGVRIVLVLRYAGRSGGQTKRRRPRDSLGRHIPHGKQVAGRGATGYGDRGD